MNEQITYLYAIKESNKVGQKPAKISQEKKVRLKNNYNSNLKAVSPNVQSAPVQAPVVNEVASAPVSVPTETVLNPVVMDNYAEVAANFNMSIYEKSFVELLLTGARKIRINSKLPLHIKGLSNKLANGKLENVIPMPNEVVNETIPNVVENNIEAKTVDFPKPQASPSVNESESIAKDNSLPSVDDYLQKEVPNTNIAQLIKQQEEKNASLRAEKEAKERQLEQKRIEKEQRQQQTILEQLREEELGLTRAIEGLDAAMLREEAEMVSMGRGK